MINLLVIDDDPDLLSVLSGYFLSQGMRVFVANNFTEGMKQSDRKRINVMITDFKLGDGEGTDLLSHFREAHPEAKLIMVSGFDDPNLEEAAKTRGADVFLKKPVDLELLTNWVNKLSGKES